MARLFPVQANNTREETALADKVHQEAKGRHTGSTGKRKREKKD